MVPSRLLAVFFGPILMLPTLLSESAAGFDIPPRPVAPPSPRSGPLILKEHRITGAVETSVARLRIVERLENPASFPVEGIYLRPIPKHAIARGLALVVDGKRMTGEILDAAKAAAVYRDIVARSKDPALLEHVGEGLLRASVFPVPAHGFVDVEIDLDVYPEDLGCGVLELAIGTRHVAEAGAPSRIDLELTAERRIETIYSPSHDACVTRQSARAAHLRFDGVSAAGSFRLYFAADSDPGGLRVVPHATPGGDGYFLVVHEPDPDRNTEVAPRDVVFVIDRSGSMKGEKWEQAVNALRFGIDSLRDGDRFAVVSFATDVRVHPAALTAADEETRRAARAHVEGLIPAGGTNIGEALAVALPLFDSTADRLPFLAFVTDGLPTVGETDVSRIVEAAAKSNPRGARLFAFGVGFDVNTILLDRLAAEGRADSTYVAPNQDLELPLSAFFAKIARPALCEAKLTIRGDGIEAWAFEPQTPQDLFAGDLLRVAGRYRGAGKATFTLQGTRAGRPVTIERTLELPAVETRNAFLPGFWAARRIGNLLLQIRLFGASPELVDEVTRLGKEHGIVTPYTAGLVVEDGASDHRVNDADSPTASRFGAPARGGTPKARAAAPAVGEQAVRDATELKKLAAGDASSRRETATADAKLRRVGARTMENRDGVWIDRTFAEAMRGSMVEVVAFSSEYFELLNRRPELAEVLALGTDLIVVVDGKAIRIVPAP